MRPTQVRTPGPDLKVIPILSTTPNHPLDNHEPVHIYVVCQAAGLITAGYSFGYVAHWSGGDTQVIQQTAERVVTCARAILDRAGLLAVEQQVAA